MHAAAYHGFRVPFFCRIAWLCFAATRIYYIYTSSYSASVLPLPCNDPDALMVGLKRLHVTRRELISQSEYKHILLTCTPSTIHNPSFDLKYTELIIFFRSLALLRDIFLLPSWGLISSAEFHRDLVCRRERDAHGAPHPPYDLPLKAETWKEFGGHYYYTVLLLRILVLMLQSVASM